MRREAREDCFICVEIALCITGALLCAAKKIISLALPNSTDRVRALFCFIRSDILPSYRLHVSCIFVSGRSNVIRQCYQYIFVTLRAQDNVTGYNNVAASELSRM